MSSTPEGPATEAQKIVLTAIMEWVEAEGTMPREADIARKLGLDVDIVAAEVAALERDGWVTLE